MVLLPTAHRLLDLLLPCILAGEVYSSSFYITTRHADRFSPHDPSYLSPYQGFRFTRLPLYQAANS